MINAATITRRFPDAYTVEILRDDSLGVLVVGDASGIRAIGFSGRRGKSDFNYRFNNPEHLKGFVTSWHDALKAKAASNIARREERKSLSSPLVLGDILSCSWGYEQTNVDYYEVIQTVGKSTVIVREISGKSVATGDMTGSSTPIPGAFIGEPMRRLVNAQGGIKITSYSWARKLEPIFNGEEKSYPWQSWSSYA